MTIILFALGATLLCSSCGPRMNRQQSVLPYEKQLPAAPIGSTPTTGRLVTFTLEQSKVAKNPVPATAENLANGKIYYGYYCLMCHGEKGDGNGPVGQGYDPKPTDLSSPAVANMTDGEVYRRMLTGIGHDPVMSQTVQTNHRWPLVMYLRTFARGSGQ